MTNEAITLALVKLKDVLMEENSLLESGRVTDHQRFISSKNQILRDLIVCQRNDPRIADMPGVREDLQRLRKLVDRNHHLLKSHVDAMTEITSMLTDVEISEDADGTYSRSGTN